MTTIGKEITFLVFDRLGNDVPELSIVIGIGLVKLIRRTNLTIAKMIPRPTPALTTIINANQSGLSPRSVLGSITDTPGALVGTCPTPPPPNGPFEAVGIPSAAPRADIYTRPFEVYPEVEANRQSDKRDLAISSRASHVIFQFGNV
jgi:hypothetical protein